MTPHDCRARWALMAVALAACNGGSPAPKPPPAEPPTAQPAQPAGIALTEGTRVVLVDAARGRELLTARDAFVTAMSPFDRQARMGSRTPVDEATFLRHVGANVLDWDESSRAAIEAAIGAVARALADGGFHPPLPATLEVVLTTGHEEMPGAPYTRGHTIVFPRDALGARVEAVFAHELFHVLSRNAPALRDRLYRAIGFEPIPPLVLAPALEARRITNPDAPVVAHAIRIRVDGEPRLATPVLVAPRDYDGGSLFDYVSPVMYVLDDKRAVALDGGEPVTVGFDQADGFFDQVGRNTGYVIHPEEILADSFRMLLFPPEKVASPEVLARVRSLLQKP